MIGKNTVINGNININGCTRIDGTIDGSIAVDNDLYIGQTAVIKASVYTKNAIVSGTINGNVVCKGRLELTSTATILGDIKYGKIVMMEGAVLTGKCNRIEAPEYLSSNEEVGV